MPADLSTTEDYLLSTLITPVAVVGNGPLAGLGSTIDSFASVIRINLFRTNKFEEHCGAKTTHWCVRFHVELPVDPLPLIPFTPYSLEDTVNFRHRKDIVFARDSMVKRIRHRAPGVLHGRFGAVNRQECETTGFALTVLLLDLGFKPVLFGFDGMSTGHYFAPTHQHWRGHTKTHHEMDYFHRWNVLHAGANHSQHRSPPGRALGRRFAGLFRRWRASAG